MKHQHLPEKNNTPYHMVICGGYAIIPQKRADVDVAQELVHAKVSGRQATANQIARLLF